MIVLYIILGILVLYNILILIKSLRYKELDMFWFNFFKPILGLVFKFYYPFKKENTEVLKNLEGPVLFCGNHIHIMDQCLAILCVKRPIHYMAKIEYFQDKKVSWFFKMMGCIPVNRQIHDENAKAMAMKVLERKLFLGLFPEGTRNKTEEILLPFKFGAVSMAKKSNATIVPIAVTGKYKFRTKNLKITFGEPFKVGEMELEEANIKLYNSILDMVIKEKHGE
jgi:1-acyl-sn-glycerol-3-phosphate acyltransferase